MDEETDLALLDQHLLKTNLLSSRMTSILAQLDTRLSRLDKTIAPLGIQPLTRKANNLDAVLLALSPAQQPKPAPSRSTSSTTTSRSQSNAHSAVKGYALESSLPTIASVPGTGTATPADETAILTRGPDLMALGEFTTALDSVNGDLERMWKGFKEGRGGAREAGVVDLSHLVEIGYTGLLDLFLRISTEGMGRLFDPDSLLQSGVPAPPHFFHPFPTVLPVTSYLSRTLLPSSPASKVQSTVQPIFDDKLAAFADARGEWIKRSLDSMVTKVEEIDEGGIWEGGGGKVKGVVDLWETMLTVVEAETLLITSLFPAPPPSLLSLTLAQPLALASNTITQTINTIKRDLAAHTFIAVDLYQSLLSLQPKWDESISKCLAMVHSSPPSLSISSPTTATSSSPSDPRYLLTALTPHTTSLRSLVLRSFPELLVDIRTAPPTGGPTANISDLTYSALTYLETLPAYGATVEGLLGTSHAERSWLMGQKDPPSSAKNAQEEGGLVNLFVADILGTLLIHLDARARLMRKPIAQTFLLNNLSHIRNTTASFDSDIIGPGAEGMLNKAFREAKGAYLSEFSSLLSLLSPSTPKASTPLTNRLVPTSEKNQIKDLAHAFFDRLGELEGIVASYPLSRQDPDLRDRIGGEILGMVGEAYGAFWERARGRGEKYAKPVEEVQRRIQAMFR